MHTNVYPFSAIVGQAQLKLALILNAINPSIGGVLIRGEKGTAKSTAVRSLAVLLPQITVYAACPFGLGPDEPLSLCDHCGLCGGKKEPVQRQVRVVTLPLNATEDRVTGGIDFEQTLRTGQRCIGTGLLAEAHRGILYVDEVNLLDDHIVDLILDAAASGCNRIEREGIAFRHSACFILVGTMNPEEGELRPQLLDRFGLSVLVEAEQEPDKRVATMLQRETFDMDPQAFREQFAEENAQIARRIAVGRHRLPQVVIPAAIREIIVSLCIENHVAGHRADLVMAQAAKALAAYREQPEVTLADLKEIAPLALAHRKREVAPPPPPPKEHEHDSSETREDDRDADSKDEDPQPEKEPTGENETDNGVGNEQVEPLEGEEPSEKDLQNQSENRSRGVTEQIFEVGDTFKVRKFASPKDRVFRRGSGRRSRTRISQKQGRYVKSTLNHGSGDVALDATLRAAAPYQRTRPNSHHLAVVLRPEDVREKIREKRIGNFLLFVVDASGSMGARGRMVASKGAIMSLLLDAYQKRDRIAMISFRKNEAVINLPPTGSIELAARLLKEMPVGGRTPLSAGLAKSYEMLRNYLLREPTARPIAIFITDGKSNVAAGPGSPVAESLAFANRLAADERIRLIVVDTEAQGLIRFGLAGQLAAAMSAQYLKIEELKADTLLSIVKGET